MSRIRYFEERRGRVEIIPMIDVMLFLLVFFIMITLQMIPDSGVALQLPHSSQSKPLPPPQYTVNVETDGTIVLKGKVITGTELVALLKGDRDPTHTQVTIAAAKDVPFQKFIDVMDDCRKAGVSDIGVATQPVQASPSAGSASHAAERVPAAAPSATH
jgi:biopolymer transport protein ExbD